MNDNRCDASCWRANLAPAVCLLLMALFLVLGATAGPRMRKRQALGLKQQAAHGKLAEELAEQGLMPDPVELGKMSEMEIRRLPAAMKERTDRWLAELHALKQRTPSEDDIGRVVTTYYVLAFLSLLAALVFCHARRKGMT